MLKAYNLCSSTYVILSVVLVGATPETLLAACCVSLGSHGDIYIDTAKSLNYTTEMDFGISLEFIKITVKHGDFREKKCLRKHIEDAGAW